MATAGFSAGADDVVDAEVPLVVVEDAADAAPTPPPPVTNLPPAI